MNAALTQLIAKCDGLYGFLCDDDDDDGWFNYIFLNDRTLKMPAYILPFLCHIVMNLMNRCECVCVLFLYSG